MEIYGGRDPRDVPLYPVREAAHYLRLPESTLRSWVYGRTYPKSGGTGVFEPIIALPEPDEKALSFHNLVEAHVLRGARREHGVPLQNVRRAIDYVEERLEIERPLAHANFETDGLDLFVEEMGRLVNASSRQQHLLGDAIRAHLKRIERDADGIASRLYLFTRERGLDQPQVVVADPRVAFGRPVVKGTGIPITILLERWLAGESVEDLAEDYGLDRDVVEEAIRCEHRRAA